MNARRLAQPGLYVRDALLADAERVLLKEMRRMREWPDDFGVYQEEDGPCVSSPTLTPKEKAVKVYATSPDDVARVLNAYRPLVAVLKAVTRNVTDWHVELARDAWGNANTRITGETLAEARDLLKSLGEGE